VISTRCAIALGLALASPLVHADEQEAGRKLFKTGTAPACAVCHTLADAQSTGAVGPVLDEIKPDAERVAKAVRMGIGVMPAFGDKLSEADIALLARYVAQATGGAAR
jgi:cytochrome c6